MRELIDQFLFDTNFYRRFSKQAIEIWILIPITPQNAKYIQTSH